MALIGLLGVSVNRCPFMDMPRALFESPAVLGRLSVAGTESRAWSLPSDLKSGADYEGLPTMASVAGAEFLSL